MINKISIYNLAIVMPSGENSFYLDGKGTGRAYGEFTGREIVSYIRKTFGLSDKKEDTSINYYVSTFTIVKYKYLTSKRKEIILKEIN